MQRTTIALSPGAKARLESYGRKGMTYEAILWRLMDEIDREQFLAKLDAGPVPPAPRADDSLRLHEILREQGRRMNPAEFDRMVASRFRRKSSR